MTRPASERLTVPGPAGSIEVLVEVPPKQHGLALVCHPHPLFGGALENKVAQTLGRAFRDAGFAVLRPNFRGVGASAGDHDDGRGETEDMLALLDWGRAHYGEGPLVLGGFSFGGHVVTRVAKRLADAGRPARRIVLIGVAAGTVTGLRHYQTEPVPPDTIVIHGERDETVPLANVLDWARPQELPVVLVPDADHFFHRKLHVLRSIIHNAWHHD